ncbi:MAG TPA: hypothetical protein VM093_07675 [Aeromicrobium sp.]|nr:hypothetical protein [Aeromicrobium sp.]
MTAAVTSLIDLAGQHGLGVAFLIVAGQVLLERLMPVEHLFAFLVGPKRTPQRAGAHRRVPARGGHRPVGCME